jgi:hypothetical protein
MTDPPADPSAEVTPPEHLGFFDWIKSIPASYALLAAAISAAVGLFAPERLLPEPLVPFRFLASLIVVVAFVLTWAWRTALRRHLRVVATVTAVLLLVLGTLNVLFVRQVSYQNPAEERYVLVGLTVADEDLRGMSDQDVVRQVGSELSALRGAYGPHLVLVVLAYALCYLLLIQSVILSLGGSELAQPRRRHTAASSPRSRKGRQRAPPPPT